VSDPDFVDEHRVLVSAPAPAVWEALGASLRPVERAGRGFFARRVLGAVPGAAHGDPLVQGSTLPGFGVREAVPERRLVLAGEHRFSDYLLVFTLEERGTATQLSARSDARFPGLRGRVYRALVIGSGAHQVIVRRWLERIRASAEAQSAHP
jgi:hypothetical protein